MAAAGDKLEITVLRGGGTNALQKFTLRTGGVLRIGRGVANDIVLDFAGVSIYHAEFYLRSSGSEGDAPVLCIRDESKNGTGVRPGPHSGQVERGGPLSSWEPLKKGALRVMEHGWQIMVPLRSRKESNQLPEALRTLTIGTGSRAGPMIADEELDGEAWEPSKVARPLVSTGGQPPPPPPDLGGGAFEEAPPPPPGEPAPPPTRPIAIDQHLQARDAWVAARGQKTQERQAKERDFLQVRGRVPVAQKEPEREASGSSDEEDRRDKKKKKKKRDGKEERKREKKERKLRKRQEESEERDSSREKKKRDKKDKKAKKRAGKEQRDKDGGGDEAQTEPGDERQEATERKKQELEQWEQRKKDREERERLEQELEDELAEEIVRKERVKKKEQAKKNEADDDKAAEDPKLLEEEKWVREVAQREERERKELERASLAVRNIQGKPAVGADSEAEEDPEIKAAWGRALAPGAAAAAAAAAAVAPTAPANEKAAPEAPTEPAAAPAAAQVPAAVEILDSEAAGGIYLRHGLLAEQPMFRRLKDEAEPVFLYYWDGGDDKSVAGWYVALTPTKQGRDDYRDFWAGEPTLPSKDKGECGGRMEARAQLDGPALAALAELPEGLRGELRAAFTAAVQAKRAAPGVPEEEPSEVVGAADDKAADDLESLPPWKRRRSMGAAARQEEGTAKAEPPAAVESAPEATADTPAGEATKSPEDAATPATTVQRPIQSPTSPQAQPTSPTAVAQPTSPTAVAPTSPAVPAPTSPTAGAAPTSPAAVPTAPGASETEDARTQHPKAEAEADQQPDTAVAPSSEPKPQADETMATVKEDVPAGEGASAQVAEVAADVTKKEATGPPAESEAAKEEGGNQTEVAPTEDNKGKTDDDADRESLPSRCSFTETNAQKTQGAGDESAPPTRAGDRGDSMAPTQAGDRAESTEPAAKDKASKVGLTAEALAKHTAALAKAQAAAYAATFASAKSHHSKSVAHKSGAGRTVRSVAGMSIAGKSGAGRSMTGKSVPSERTFRTHVTSRELVVGASMMRELMRSVSPISTPGVPVKRRRRGSDSGSPRRKKKDKKKKDKKEKGLQKHKASKRDKTKPARAQSPSHYAPQSPTPYRGRTEASTTEQPKDPSEAAPSHWTAPNQPSTTPQPTEESHWMASSNAARPKKRAKAEAAGTERWAPPREVHSPCSSASGRERQAGAVPGKKRRKKERRPREPDPSATTVGADVSREARGRSPERKKKTKEGKEGKSKKARKRSP